MTALDEGECFVTCVNGNHVYKEISSVLVSQPLNIARRHLFPSWFRSLDWRYYNSLRAT